MKDLEKQKNIQRVALMVAKGLTAIYLMCAQLCKVHISLASVFTDYFMEDFTSFIKMKHS